MRADDAEAIGITRDAIRPSLPSVLPAARLRLADLDNRVSGRNQILTLEKEIAKERMLRAEQVRESAAKLRDAEAKIECLRQELEKANPSAEIKRRVYAEVQETNAKYKEKGTLAGEGGKKRDGFEGVFGDQAVFFEGLAAYAGSPMVATEEQLFEAMKREFNECIDPRVDLITTTNYGGLETELATEWEFVTDFKAGKLYPGAVGNTKKMPNEDRDYPGREPKTLEELIEDPYCKKANLMRIEVLGLRLYTGPAYVAINGSLRWAYYRKGKQDCLPQIHLPQIDDMIKSDGSITMDHLSTALSESKSFSEYFMDDQELKATFLKTLWERTGRYFKNTSTITQEEFQRFRLMEGGCGKRDYGACKNRNCVACAAADKLGGKVPGAACKFWECGDKISKACLKCAPGADAFTNTIAVINSGIKKLSKVTPLEKVSELASSGTLYRGIDGMAFPKELLEIDDLSAEEFKDKCKGFVEFGMHIYACMYTCVHTHTLT